MKKYIAVAALALAPSVAMANPGCGWGSMVFEGQSGLGPHVLAATTNGTSGNQTFGMTFGTGGCDTSKTVMFAGAFLNDNLDQIAENISAGKGEALEAFAELLGVKIQDYQTFAGVMNDNFATIFANQDVTADQVMGKTLELMKENSALSQYAS